MAGTFFQMRDELSARMGKAGKLARSDVTDLHVFRVLMSYGVYSKSSPSYGYVARKACPVEFLARECGCCAKTVKAALRHLDEAGFITRLERTGPHGRVASDIRLDWVE